MYNLKENVYKMLNKIHTFQVKYLKFDPIWAYSPL